MKKPLFEGLATAIITPMDPYGNIDFKALEGLLEFQLANEADAIVVNGTTGESSALEDWEKLALAEFVIKYVDKRIPVIVGTGSNHTAHAVFLSKEAEALGADGLLQVTPYYNKTSQEGLLRHFTSIGDNVKIPMILYNVPTRTGMTIQPETYKKLAEHPQIWGTKEASGNISHIAKTAALCGKDFAVYSGNDDQIVPILSLGGKGVISVAGNVMPKEVGKICRLFKEGKIEESASLQLKLLDLMNAMFCDVNPIPAKAALSMMGMCKDICRLPLVPLGEEKREHLKAVLKRHELIKDEE